MVVAQAADAVSILQPQADQAAQGRDRVPVIVAVAQPAAASRAVLVNRLEHPLAIRPRSDLTVSSPGRPFHRALWKFSVHVTGT